MRTSIAFTPNIASTAHTTHCHYSNFSAHHQVVDFIERTTGKRLGFGVWCRTRAFVAAVSLDDNDRPRFLKLNLVSGFTSDAIAKWAKASLAPGCAVVSDGLGCFAAVTTAGRTHQAVIVGDRKPRDLPQFPWVNTVLGNLKTTLAGAYHSLKYRKYAAHYLGAFAYRFNRRFDLRDLVSRLIVDVARCAPIREQVVRQHAEARF